jgi:hypothetical protein
MFYLNHLLGPLINPKPFSNFSKSAIILPPVSLTQVVNGRPVSLAPVIILNSTIYVHPGQAADVVNVRCQFTAGINDSSLQALFGHFFTYF